MANNIFILTSTTLYTTFTLASMTSYNFWCGKHDLVYFLLNKQELASIFISQHNSQQFEILMEVTMENIAVFYCLNFIISWLLNILRHLLQNVCSNLQYCEHTKSNSMPVQGKRNKWHGQVIIYITQKKNTTNIQSLCSSSSSKLMPYWLSQQDYKHHSKDGWSASSALFV